jgi:hypothetical protein
VIFRRFYQFPRVYLAAPLAGVGFFFDILDSVDIYAEYLLFGTEIDSELICFGIIRLNL